MAKMTIQEARELGLLSPEELAALGQNPFTPRAGASWTPNLGIRPGLNSSSFFRYPGLYQRPGISSLRFGLGGLGQGLTLSPESPALGLAGIAAPVGRSAASRGASYGVAGGIAGGVAGGRAAIGSEGSGNLPTMILPDGRRLIRLPDGRAFIVGGPQRMVSAEAPEGLAALQAMGMISQGVGAVKQLADLISKIPGGAPGGTPGGVPGGVPGGAPGGVAEEPEGPGAGLVRPASLQQGPATPADALLLPPESGAGAIPGLVARTPEEAAFLEANAAFQGEGAAPGGPLAPGQPLDMAQFGPGTTFEMANPPAPFVPPPDVVSGATGGAGVANPGDFTTPFIPSMDGGGGDLSLSQAFYAPGGTGFNALDPETRRLYELGLTPEQIMGMMPAPAAGRADTAPRGLGPGQADIFGGGEPGTGAEGGVNFTVGKTLGLGQSLLGVGQGVLGAGITGDPSQLVGAIIKSGMSVNDIAKIPGLNQAGISAGLGGALGILNLVQAARSGNIPGAIGGGLSALGGAAGLAKATPSIASALGGLGIGSNALGAVGAGAGGVGGLLSLATGVKGLIDGGASPVQSAISIGGGLTSTYAAIQTLSALYPTLFNTVLPTITQLISSGLSAIGGGAAAGAAGGAAAGAGAAGGAAAGAAGGAGATGAAGGAAAGGLAALPVLIASAPAIIGEMLWAQEKAATQAQAVKKFKSLSAAIPGTFAALQTVPGLIQELERPGLDPKRAAAIYAELNGIQKSFNDSGLEDFIKYAGTKTLGNIQSSVGFEQAGQVQAQMKPLWQALDYGRLRASDLAARGGIEIPGALTADSYAMSLGSQGFNESFRPQGYQALGAPNPMALRTGRFGVENRDPVTGNLHSWTELQDIADSQQATPFFPVVMGAKPGPDVINFLRTFAPELAALGGKTIPGGMSPGGGDFDPVALPDRPALTNQAVYDWMQTPQGRQVMDSFSAPAGYGRVNTALFNELRALQPGQYESGLREIFGRYRGDGDLSGNPYFNQQATAQPSVGSMAFNPLKFLSSLEAGQRTAIQSGQDTLTFVPYKPDQSQMFAAPDSGYQQIGEGFYAKSSGQGAGAEIYLPQDKASDLGKALAGYQGSPVAGQVGALLATPVPSGQEAGAVPGAGPAGDIAPEAVAAGTSSTGQPVGTVAPPPDATQPLPGAGFKKGGMVPKTGKYLVHEGEVVIPADKADTEVESEEFLEDMRKRGDLKLGAPGQKLEMPTMGPGPFERGEDPTMPDEAAAPKEKGWYVHIKEGVPSQDLDGNDPMVRRLAFTPDEVEQAIEAGEAPIMVGKGVLALPPSAIRGFLQNAQNMQNKDPMKHPAMVAMGNRIRQAQAMEPEGNAPTLPYPGLGGKIIRGNQPRFKGDRGRGADKPLDSASAPSEIGGGLTGADDSFRNMDVLPKSLPDMPSIPDAVPPPDQFQVRGLGGPGIGRAMRLAQGPSADFARQDRMLEGIDRGTIAPSTLGGASREQRQNLTPEDIMRRPSRPAGAPQPQPQPGLLEQFRRRVTG